MEWAKVHDLLLIHEVLGAKECNDLRSSCQSNHRLEGFYTECLADHADGITLKYPLGYCWMGRLDLSLHKLVFLGLFIYSNHVSSH